MTAGDIQVTIDWILSYFFLLIDALLFDIHLNLQIVRLDSADCLAYLQLSQKGKSSELELSWDMQWLA